MIRDFQRETLWDVCGQADKVCDECEGMRSFLTPSGRVRVVLRHCPRDTSLIVFCFLHPPDINIDEVLSPEDPSYRFMWCIDWPFVCVCVWVWRYVWWWEPCIVAFFHVCKASSANLMILLRLRRQLYSSCFCILLLTLCSILPFILLSNIFIGASHTSFAVYAYYNYLHALNTQIWT